MNLADFKIRRLPIPTGFENELDQPVAVDRLREVIALCGFTRIDGPDDASRADRIAPAPDVASRRRATVVPTLSTPDLAYFA